MKKSIRKILALVAAVIMVLALAACGGGSSGGSSEAPAEPNSGVAGIVFSVPEDWTVSGAEQGNYIAFKANDGYDFGMSAFDENSLKDFNEYSDEEDYASVEEYFKSRNTGNEDRLKERGVERTEGEVCGVKSYEYTGKSDNGAAGFGTDFYLDGVYYSVYLDAENAYDENGVIKKDLPAISDDLQAAYKGVIASIQAGDGDALLSKNLNVNSVGSMTFEVPEGYSVTGFSDEYVTLGKDGSEIKLQISTTDKDDLEWMEDEDGNHPESVEAWYKERTEYMEDSDKVTVAGIDGYKMQYPAEDDNYYDVSAFFMSDDVIYDVRMDTDAWDNNGNIKEGAVQLSQEDFDTFDAFLASVKAK